MSAIQKEISVAKQIKQHRGVSKIIEWYSTVTR